MLREFAVSEETDKFDRLWRICE